MTTDYNKFSRKRNEDSSEDSSARNYETKTSNKTPENKIGNEGIWTAIRPVNFRTYAGKEATIIRVINAGEKVASNGNTIIVDGEEWISVTTNERDKRDNLSGYVMRKFFAKV